MKPSSVNILGVRIDPISINALNQQIIDHVRSGSKPLVVFKPYVEFLSLAARNENIRDLLNQSDINAADSTALQWAASYLYGEPPTGSNSLSTLRSLLVNLQLSTWRNQVLPERMAGVDQTLPLLKLANAQRLRIGILGGPKDTEQTRRAIQSRFGDINLDVWSGYFSSSGEKKIISAIREFQPDILFCALGFPKQEEFIIRNRNKLGAKVIIGEGGSFDYNQLGGKIKRAPKWMRKIGMEWLWRLFLQPKRIGRQIAIPVFVRKVQRQRKS